MTPTETKEALESVRDALQFYADTETNTLYGVYVVDVIVDGEETESRDNGDKAKHALALMPSLIEGVGKPVYVVNCDICGGTHLADAYCQRISPKED